MVTRSEFHISTFIQTLHALISLKEFDIRVQADATKTILTQPLTDV